MEHTLCVVETTPFQTPAHFCSLYFRSRAPLATTCKSSLGAIQKVVQHRQTIMLVPLAAGFYVLNAKPVAVLSRPACSLN